MQDLLDRYTSLYADGMSKSDVAKVISRENPTMAPPQCIELLVKSLDMTKSGANTYYSKYLKSSSSDTPLVSPSRVNEKSVLIPFKSKAEFVALPAVQSYIDALADLIAGDEFCHSYKKWGCLSLPDAKQQYYWHGDYQSNKEQIEQLSKGLRSACDSGNEGEALYWCIKILDWGKVYKESISYVLSKYEQNRLCSTVLDGINIMDGEAYALSRFDQNDLRMDSGLTKIYSMGSRRNIIYDSRVTAALFLIAVKLLPPTSVTELENIYALAGGKSQSRNQPDKRKRVEDRVARVTLQPLLTSLDFPLQAHLNLLTNWVLQAAIVKASERTDLESLWDCSEPELMRSIESALFMIGADIDSK